ncbi:MAG TPA: hypothetical protein VGQ53_18605 [Chitinophagaceae bacterium]|jgi:uncharacterized iron-regulated membrane protein|nr:hypothetical protein [Chitinophagaceae bacterium]
MAKGTIHNSMRIYHRYLGFFLAGIMAVYAISGVVMIFRDTDFLKREKQVEKKLAPGLKVEELGQAIRIRNLKADAETNDLIRFQQGYYNKLTGMTMYVTKSLPKAIEKLTQLHKASTKQPLFYLNVFFGIGLLFFVISSFWMFMPKTTIFKKGLYFTIAGILITIILLFA